MDVPPYQWKTFDELIKERVGKKREVVPSTPREPGRITLRFNFYHDPAVVLTGANSTDTIGEVITRIINSMKPRKRYSMKCHAFTQIEDDAMLLYEGNDLRKLDPSLTLRDIPMARWADILVMYPGHLRPGSKLRSQSSDLKCLADRAWKASKTIPADKILELVETSCDTKNIFVEAPVSEDIDLVTSINVRLEDKIADVKEVIEDSMVETCTHWEFTDKIQKLNPYALSYATELDPNLTLADYDVKEATKLTISWKKDMSIFFAPLQSRNRMISQLQSEETLEMMNTQIQLLHGIHREVQGLAAGVPLKGEVLANPQSWAWVVPRHALGKFMNPFFGDEHMLMKMINATKNLESQESEETSGQFVEARAYKRRKLDVLV